MTIYFKILTRPGIFHIFKFGFDVLFFQELGYKLEKYLVQRLLCYSLLSLFWFIFCKGTILGDNNITNLTVTVCRIKCYGASKHVLPCLGEQPQSGICEQMWVSSGLRGHSPDPEIKSTGLWSLSSLRISYSISSAVSGAFHNARYDKYWLLVRFAFGFQEPSKIIQHFLFWPLAIWVFSGPGIPYLCSASENCLQFSSSCLLRSS